MTTRIAFLASVFSLIMLSASTVAPASTQEPVPQADEISVPVAEAVKEPVDEAINNDDATKPKSQHVSIEANEDGFKINGYNEDGDYVDVDIDLGGELGNKIAAKVLKKLSDKGLIDVDDIDITLEDEPMPVDDHHLIKIEASADGGGIADDIVPLLAITLLFGSPLLIVAVVSFNSYRRRKLLHDNVNKLIEQGKDIPPELFDYFEGKNKPQNNFRRGVILTAIGAGTSIALSSLAGISVGALGLIPLFLGMAYLFIWKLEQHDQVTDDQPFGRL